MLYGDTSIISDITECDADSVILQAGADVICTKSVGSQAKPSKLLLTGSSVRQEQLTILAYTFDCVQLLPSVI